MPKRKPPIDKPEKEKVLKRYKRRANKLYGEMIAAIQDINEATGRFYDRSKRYAKQLKKIEDVIDKDD